MRLSPRALLGGRASNTSDASSASSSFRTRREQEHLLPLIAAISKRVGQPISILDIGGRFETWQRLGVLYNDTIATIHVTNYEERPATTEAHPKVTFEGGIDARQLPYLDGAYDLVYANSVIEHVGGLCQQQAMVKEIERVAGHGVYLQTPNKRFVIDPHFARVPVPFFQWLPLALRGVLLWLLPMAHSGRMSSYASGRRTAAGVTLVTPPRLVGFFSSSSKPSLRRERFLGLTKSLMIVVGPD